MPSPNHGVVELMPAMVHSEDLHRLTPLEGENNKEHEGRIGMLSDSYACD